TRLWKEPKCPLTIEWIKKMWYIYIYIYYLVVKKNDILPFTIKWMELRYIMLSEVSQSEKTTII
ncbi:LORF2 protein, partial [Crocuta crocuta]